MSVKRIVMNFSTPPSSDDVGAVAQAVVDTLPVELVSFADNMDIVLDEFPPAEVMDALDLENEFDLLALYRGESEKIPGVVAKSGKGECALILYRRPILDLWCDSGEDFVNLVRNVVISEIAQANGFSDEEIETMCAAAAATDLL